jgi:hypothetical protein
LLQQIVKAGKTFRFQRLSLRVLGEALVFPVALLLIVAASSSGAPRSSLFQPSATQKKPVPRAVIDGTVRDFGDVYFGEELEQVFHIANTGDAPLELAEKQLSQRREHFQRFEAIPVAFHRAPT